MKPLKAVGLLILLLPGIAWADTLERAVVVVRHGIRSPLQAPAQLQARTGCPWPRWPVGAGEMTAHGGAMLARMGDFLRERYVESGLLGRRRCAVATAGQDNDFTVWADAADRRTRRSGQILATSLAPGCGATAGWRMTPGDDPLFLSPPAAEPRPVTTVNAPRVLAVLRDHLGLGHADAAPVVAQAASMAYAEGFPVQGICRATSDDDLRQLIAAAMVVHDATDRRARRAAATAGGPLADKVCASLRGEGAKLLILAGHDSNLDTLAGAFHLGWTLPGQPDQTAPDTALAFERWRDEHGVETLRISVFYQTLTQFRTASPGTLSIPNAVALPTRPWRGGANDCAR